MKCPHTQAIEQKGLRVRGVDMEPLGHPRSLAPPLFVMRLNNWLSLAQIPRFAGILLPAVKCVSIDHRARTQRHPAQGELSMLLALTRHWLKIMTTITTDCPRPYHTLTSRCRERRCQQQTPGTCRHPYCHLRWKKLQL